MNQTTFYEPVTVTDGSGNSSPVFQPSIITVDPRPLLSWEVSETDVCYGEKVYFILSFTGFPPWNFEYEINGEIFTDTIRESPVLLSWVIFQNTLFRFDSVSDWNGCMTNISEEVTVSVRPHPEITCPDTIQVYHADPPVMLDYATPIGGVYSGNNVYFEENQYFFDPLICPGDYKIDYCYHDSQSGCITCCSFYIRVLLPEDLQIIHLSQGWSGISCYLEPYNNQLGDIFAGLIASHQLEIMIGENGVFWPGQNINTLNQWKVHQGYKLKMNEPGCVKIAGSFPHNKTFNVKKGATYIPVLCRQPVPADQIMSQLGSNLIFTVDIKTLQIYWPAGGIYTLDFLNPGTGYLVNLTNNSGITYTCADSNLKSSTVSTIMDQWMDAPWKIEKSPVMHLITMENQSFYKLEEGDFIGVFNEDGFCCGMARYQEELERIPLIAFGKDENQPGEAGFFTGDPMYFRIHKSVTHREYELVPSFDPDLPDGGYFSEFGQTGIINAEINDHNDFNDLNGLTRIKITALPATGEIIIHLKGIPGLLTTEVVNLAGQVVHKEFYNATGMDNYLLKSDGIQPGIYILKIKYENQDKSAKLFIK